MLFISILVGLAFGILFSIWIGSTGRLSQWRKEQASVATTISRATSGTPWEELTERAQRQVDLTLAELPEDVRGEAVQVPCLFQEYHPTNRHILGVYHNVSRTDLATRKGPIILYLRTIESYAAAKRIDFEEQVRKTFLHELGHHVGWNEGQVRERGL